MIQIPRSITKSTYRDTILAVIRSALDAAEPGQAVKRHVQLHLETFCIDGAKIDLSSVDRIRALGVGKAAQSMVSALVDILGGFLGGGLVIVKRGEIDPSVDTGSVEIAEADHPVPDASGMEASKRMARIASEMGERDLALAVIAGGASSLLTLPAEGLSLEDLQATTGLLLHSGADIQELNAVRKHISSIKGGQLAGLIAPARTIGLILSDVVFDPLDAIGSGPTAPDPTTYADALSVLERYKLKEKVPFVVLGHLRSGAEGEIAETPKPINPLFGLVRNTIVGSNRYAAEAAVKAAREHGLNALLLTTALKGEAREVGENAASLARDLARRDRPIPRPACLVLGGETTVTVRGQGKGGRNQELALSAAFALDGLKDVVIVALATDGGDGPTDAAGGVATGDTASRARSLGFDPERHLENNDAYPVFDALSDLIRTGPTHTNVADLIFVFAF